MGASTSKKPTFADKVILDHVSKQTLSGIDMPRLCGYLHLGIPNAKLPIFPKRWRRRYFVLHQSRLECYAGNQASSRLLCTFNITGSSVESAGDSKKSRLRFGLVSNKVMWLHLIADSEGLKQVWMRALRVAADPKFTKISGELLARVGNAHSDEREGDGGSTGQSNDEHSEAALDEDIEPPLFVRQVSYDIQTEDEVAHEMDVTVENAASAMSVSQVQARVLLSQKKWDLENLINDILDPSKEGTSAQTNESSTSSTATASNVPAAAAAEASTPSKAETPSDSETPSDASSTPSAPEGSVEVEAVPPEVDEEECLICEEEFGAAEFGQLGCGCKVCSTCLTGHCVNFIDEQGRNASIIGCPACQVPVPDAVVQDRIPADLLVKWKHFRTLRYVDQNPKVKWCPSGCGRAVRYARGLATDVYCPCGAAYCFACNESPHAPLLCSQAKEWKKLADVAMSSGKSELYEDDAAWLLSFTKPCPRCKNPIQKNQGCDHMTCKVVAGGCGFEFCWVCLGTYAGHNTSTCSVSRGNARIKQILGDQIEKRGHTKLTKRFEAYHGRFANHNFSGKFAGKTISQLEDLAAKIENSGWDHSEQQPLQASLGALRSAAQVVLRAHAFLGNAYALAYYLIEDNCTSSDLFHTVRILLEEATEKLHQCIESPKEILNMVLRKPFQFKKLLQNRANASKAPDSSPNTDAKPGSETASSSKQAPTHQDSDPSPSAADSDATAPASKTGEQRSDNDMPELQPAAQAQSDQPDGPELPPAQVKHFAGTTIKAQLAATDVQSVDASEAAQSVDSTEAGTNSPEPEEAKTNNNLSPSAVNATQEVERAIEATAGGFVVGDSCSFWLARSLHNLYLRGGQIVSR